MSKKLLLICSFLLNGILFATDIRQVMFGNNFETIQEIDSNLFLSEFSAIKNYVSNIELGDFNMRNHDKDYFRVFEQIIGEKRFIRVVRGVNPLTDEYILSWRNPEKINKHENHAYIIQMFYLPKNEMPIAILPFCRMDADGYSWENGTFNKYEMIEIIQRNENVKGFLLNRLEDNIDHHNRAEENGKYVEKYINTAEYYLFDDVKNNATAKYKNIQYVNAYNIIPKVEVRTDQPLIDSNRPFMYTVNNIFDGNPKTAYVENTDDNLIFITVYKDNFEKITKVKLINGYSFSYDLYKKNSRVKSLGDYYISSGSIDNSKTFYSDKSVRIKDLYNEYQILDWDDSIFAVTSIYDGEKYTDTCISELDFYDQTFGWIFGD